MLIKNAEEIGIQVITSKLIAYALPKGEKNEMKGVYKPIDEIDETKYDVMKISGTQQRKMLQDGEDIPQWFSFPAVIDELSNTFNKDKGFCLYFVGLSGSGKSTIANFLMSKLRERIYKQITYLDGDIVRLHLSKGLGFTPEDRSLNVRRIGFVAAEVVKHNGIAVTANIAPFEEDRKYIVLTFFVCYNNDSLFE